MLISTKDIIHLMLARGVRCERINKTPSSASKQVQPERDWVRVNGRNISKESINNNIQYNSFSKIFVDINMYCFIKRLSGVHNKKL